MTQQQTDNPFKVGDRIKSIAHDNPIRRPYGSEFTVVKVFRTNVYYMDGYATHYSNFELVKPTTQKEPPMKTPKLFRIFDKNKQPNIPGIFHQLHKFGNIDPRPFVQQLIKDEQTRIFEALQYPHPCLNNYNIKLTYACQKLDEMSTFTDPYIEVTPEHILAYYLYQKESNNQTNYSWIASYLNHYYMSSPERVVLFHSNHRYIYIENGYLTLEESNNTYSVPIQYDSTSNTFYI